MPSSQPSGQAARVGRAAQECHVITLHQILIVFRACKDDFRGLLEIDHACR
jgi:hypothetical protein